jgi:hypothetical protein
MWIEDTYRRLHLDFHMPDWSPEILARFDAGQIVESTLRARADALYFFAKCHYGNAYYRTEVGHRHRGMGERDFLAEVIEECRKAKLTVVAYFSLVWDQWASLQHPDWCMRDPEGNAVLQFWPYLCFNSPYREYTQSMLRELVKGYDIDGIHFDMINFPFNGLACYCDRCRRLFLEEHGLRIPERPTWDEPWRAFLRFRNETVSRFAGELQRVVREQKPGLRLAGRAAARGARLLQRPEHGRILPRRFRRALHHHGGPLPQGALPGQARRDRHLPLRGPVGLHHQARGPAALGAVHGPGQRV